MIIRKEKICHESQMSFRRMLEAYEEVGVVLFMDGKRMSAGAIADRYMVREEPSYMLDFIPDPSGRKVREIRLDKVSPKTDNPSVGSREKCRRGSGRRS